MNAEDQDFEALKKLLALKRHETPPPGYFDNFSSKVIARIESSGAAAEASLWQRIISYIETRPARVSTIALAGVAVVAVMVNLAPGGGSGAGAGNGAGQASLAGVTRAGSITENMAANFSRPDLLATMPAVTLQPAALAADVDVPGGPAIVNPDAAPAGLFNLNGNLRDFSTDSVPQRVSLQLERR